MRMSTSLRAPYSQSGKAPEPPLTVSEISFSPSGDPRRCRSASVATPAFLESTAGHKDHFLVWVDVLHGDFDNGLNNVIGPRETRMCRPIQARWFGGEFVDPVKLKAMPRIAGGGRIRAMVAG
jgi:hypothetical protein